LNIKVGLRLVDDLREAMQLSSVPRCTADVLQLEDLLDDLNNRELGIGRAGTVVESSTIEIVGS